MWIYISVVEEKSTSFLIYEHEIEKATFFPEAKLNDTEKVLRQTGPQTRTDKIVGMAVREMSHNRAIQNTASLANPESLKFYEDLKALHV
ncbi:MAG: hypothetical protein JKY13_00085 [Gammaproteobacteria bacterium]|nr:hypothetical protein [Gammaproteobacteria bacterium]